MIKLESMIGLFILGEVINKGGATSETTTVIPIMHVALLVASLLLLASYTNLAFPKLSLHLSLVSFVLYIIYIIFRRDYMPLELFLVADISYFIALIYYFIERYRRFKTKTKVYTINLNGTLNGLIADVGSLKEPNVVEKDGNYTFNLPKDYELKEGERWINREE